MFASHLKFSFYTMRIGIDCKNIILKTFCSIILLSFFFVGTSFAVEFDKTFLKVRISKRAIVVNAFIKVRKDFKDSLKSGIKKEVKITVVLSRVRLLWPDKPVKKKVVKRVIKYNSLREKYLVTSFDGFYLNEKHFENYSEMLNWTMTIQDLTLIQRDQLNPGRYVVTLLAESKRVKLPLLLSYLLFFMPEKEVNIKKNSPLFVIK